MHEETKERWKEKKKPAKRQRQAQGRGRGLGLEPVVGVEAREVREEQAELSVEVRREEEEEEMVVVRRQVEGEQENLVPAAALDPLEKGFLAHAQREHSRMNERLLQRTYSKKNKTVSYFMYLSIYLFAYILHQHLS